MEGVQTLVTLEPPSQTLLGERDTRSSCEGHWPLGPSKALLPSPRPSTHFVGLADGPQGNPHGAHHGVPDETLVPHLHCQPQIQAVNLAVERGEGHDGVIVRE